VTHDLFQDDCEQTHTEITYFNVDFTVRIQQTKQLRNKEVPAAAIMAAVSHIPTKSFSRATPNTATQHLTKVFFLHTLVLI